MATPVTHFEIYAEEPAKLADFYRNMFGWQLEKMSGIDYWRIQTGPAGTPGWTGIGCPSARCVCAGGRP